MHHLKTIRYSDTPNGRDLNRVAIYNGLMLTREQAVDILYNRNANDDRIVTMTAEQFQNVFPDMFARPARKNKLSIAIDGPVAAGKTTVAKLLVRKLGFRCVNSGMLYRAAAYVAHTDDITDDDLSALLNRAEITVRYDGDSQRAFIKESDVTGLLYSPEVTELTAVLSTRKPVIDAVSAVLQNVAEHNDVVMEGRSVGSVVLPYADLKVYITASLPTRQERRYKQLHTADPAMTPEKAQDNVRQRDHSDSFSEGAPLVKTNESMFLDSTSITAEEAADIIRKRWYRIYNS